MDRKGIEKTKRNIRLLFYSIFSWVLAAGLYFLVRYFGTRDVADWNPHNYQLLYIAGCLACGALLGIAYWFTLLAEDSPVLRTKSYGFLMIVQGVLLVASVIVMVFFGKVFNLIFLRNITAVQLIPSFLEKLFDKKMLVILLYVGIVAVLFSFIRQMTKMTGRRVLVNLLLGKYYHPKTEDRIFMFLDITDSTAIAERLGHARSCRLIQDCWSDLTDSAIRHQVEIYQYVGDEAILTWKIDDGVRDSNCIKVFFDFEEILRKKSALYKERYGVLPQFKAGVNAGAVTVAQVGVLKRDIAYISDVLNTCARLEGKCKEFGRRILVSGFLKKILNDDAGLKYELIGDINFKGKEGVVEVFSVEKV
jgi:adenylate cyclase